MTLEGKLQKLLGEQLAISLPISYNETIIIRNSECDPMFCPNCGKDCADANFCSHCGTKLKSNNADMGAAQNNQISLKRGPFKQGFPAPPVKKLFFSGGDGFIELTDDSVRIRKRDLILGISDRTIPYSEIYKVYFDPGRTLHQGNLCVRAWMDRYITPSISDYEAVHDPCCAYVPKRSNEDFQKVYLFLKECAEIANAARNGEDQD